MRGLEREAEPNATFLPSSTSHRSDTRMIKWQALGTYSPFPSRRKATIQAIFNFATLVRIMSSLVAAGLYALCEHLQFPVRPMRTWLDSPLDYHITLNVSTIGTVTVLYFGVALCQGWLLKRYMAANWRYRNAFGWEYKAPEPRLRDD
ncbi:hypothetical protein LTR53_001008 [Teratosphaeriaceae sp. CCFEE 6253]|nr:hypothetical protein LTR53_001008 [Teratosphaeriaceae sp. CCFEE 6253]